MIALDTEPVKVKRCRTLFGECVIPCTTLILDVRDYQRQHPSKNSFSVALQSIAKGLSQRAYRSEIVIWGEFRIPDPGFPWFLFCFTPDRPESCAKVCRELLDQPAVVEFGSDNLSSHAEPLLKWRPGQGLIRLWGKSPATPNFEPHSGTRFHHAVFYDGVRSGRWPEAVQVGNNAVRIHNRRYVIEYIDN